MIYIIGIGIISKISEIGRPLSIFDSFCACRAIDRRRFSLRGVVQKSFCVFGARIDCRHGVATRVASLTCLVVNLVVSALRSTQVFHVASSSWTDSTRAR